MADFVTHRFPVGVSIDDTDIAPNSSTALWEGPEPDGDLVAVSIPVELGYLAQRIGLDIEFAALAAFVHAVEADRRNHQ